MFFNVLFAGIIAFNFYEPLAGLLAANVSFISHMADMICLMAVFCVALTLLRLTTETIAPTMVRFPSIVYNIGRFVFAVAASTVTVAILLLAFECAPVHKKVFNVIDYNYKPPFGRGLDHEWLGFFQFTTGTIFADYNSGAKDPTGEYGSAKVFDPQARWLLDHQDARPFGTETVLGGAEAAPAAGAGGPAPTSGMPSTGSGAKPGDPAIVGPAVGGGVVLPN